MKVHELIKLLQAAPQDVEVHVNNDADGNYYEHIGAMLCPAVGDDQEAFVIFISDDDPREDPDRYIEQ